MRGVRIVEHFRPTEAAKELAVIDRLAGELVRQRPELAVQDQVLPLAPERLTDAPALCLDDLSEIPFLDHGLDVIISKTPCGSAGRGEIRRGEPRHC